MMHLFAYRRGVRSRALRTSEVHDLRNVDTKKGQATGADLAATGAELAATGAELAATGAHCS